MRACAFILFLFPSCRLLFVSNFRCVCDLVAPHLLFHLSQYYPIVPCHQRMIIPVANQKGVCQSLAFSLCTKRRMFFMPLLFLPLSFVSLFSFLFPYPFPFPHPLHPFFFFCLLAPFFLFIVAFTLCHPLPLLPFIISLSLSNRPFVSE